MTDDTEALIKELRKYSARPSPVGAASRYARAADALEAQAKRIRELEGDVQILGIDKRAAEAERDALAGVIAEVEKFVADADDVGGTLDTAGQTPAERVLAQLDRQWRYGLHRILSAPASDALSRATDTPREGVQEASENAVSLSVPLEDCPNAG